MPGSGHPNDTTEVWTGKLGGCSFPEKVKDDPLLKVIKNPTTDCSLMQFHTPKKEHIECEFAKKEKYPQ